MQNPSGLIEMSAPVANVIRTSEALEGGRRLVDAGLKAVERTGESRIYNLEFVNGFYDVKSMGSYVWKSQSTIAVTVPPEHFPWNAADNFMPEVKDFDSLLPGRTQVAYVEDKPSRVWLNVRKVAPDTAPPGLYKSTIGIDEVRAAFSAAFRTAESVTEFKVPEAHSCVRLPFLDLPNQDLRLATTPQHFPLEHTSYVPDAGASLHTVGERRIMCLPLSVEFADGFTITAAFPVEELRERVSDIRTDGVRELVSLLLDRETPQDADSGGRDQFNPMAGHTF